ncbi:MAG: 3-hydroxybutyryl-CoA dehydrogenase [Deltaproteobacteria bacterium]|nr:3-hydroxybutyryl-CoA dehydrogenase [Deltaproteobacteria bacterium]
MARIETIGVVGAGQMGAGIAQVSAQSGYQTLLWDANGAALESGTASIRSQIQKMKEKGKITDKDAASALDRLKAAGSLSEFAKADLVIEAIVEKFEVKAALLGELSNLVQPDAIFASNTSSISITRLAAASGRPERFIGMHFMNPVPVMKLLEIIRGLQTSQETYEASSQVAERMGKTCVLAIDSPGFIVNRILVPMVNEAIFLLQEGVRPEDIDNAMKLGTNQPMGPLALADFVGLDTLLFILQILHRELGDDKYRPCPLLIKYVEAGWHGKKTGRGFYTYS